MPKALFYAVFDVGFWWGFIQLINPPQKKTAQHFQSIHGIETTHLLGMQFDFMQPLISDMLVCKN